VRHDIVRYNTRIDLNSDRDVVLSFELIHFVGVTDELNMIISSFSERVYVYIFQNNYIAIATPDEIIYLC